MGTSSNLHVRIDGRTFCLHSSYDGYPSGAGFQLAETFVAMDSAFLAGTARSFRSLTRDRDTDTLPGAPSHADMRKALETCVAHGGGRWSEGTLGGGFRLLTGHTFEPKMEGPDGEGIQAVDS